MIELAQRQGALLQVGHIERFNPAFEELLLHPLQPKFITCERYSGFSGRSTDIGVVLDLMIHDLDLVLALVQAPVRTVEALGVSVLGGNEDLAQARVTFANGCVADLKASRVHPTPVRCMQVFGPEGFAGVDFARRHLTLMQPAEHLRQRQLDSRRLDPATLATLKSELFGRHLQVQELDCNAGDQLTKELQEFVRQCPNGPAAACRWRQPDATRSRWPAASSIVCTRTPGMGRPARPVPGTCLQLRAPCSFLRPGRWRRSASCAPSRDRQGAVGKHAR